MKKLGIIAILTFLVMIGIYSTLNVTAEILPMEADSYTYYEDYEFIKLEYGYQHTIALTEEGKVFTWGNNEAGQLGDNTTVSKSSPIDITSKFPLSAGEKVVDVAAGYNHTGILTSLGKVYTWGANTKGELGDDTWIAKTVPVNITARFTLASGEKVVELDFMMFNSSALTSNGRLFTWGESASYALGSGSLGPSKVPLDVTGNISLLPGEKVASFSFGRDAAIALSSNNRVFTWGRNYEGQIGNGTTTEQSMPLEITANFSLDEDEVVEKVEFGYFHASAITSTGKLFMWGYNMYGQLGTGFGPDELSPVNITSQMILDPSDRIVETAMGTNHTLIRTEMGRIFATGGASHGELGNNSGVFFYAPTEITSWIILDEEEEISDLIACSYMSGAITSSGKLLAWGWNNFGQIGDGTLIDKYVPGRVYVAVNTVTKTVFPRNEVIAKGFVGNNYTSVITELNKVYIWGVNNDGILGTGDTVPSMEPIDIKHKFNLVREDSIIDMALYSSHTLALSQMGRVYAWGNNFSGQLGNGTTERALEPVEITSMFLLSEGEQIIDVESGIAFSGALSSTGEVYLWGENENHQLGNGDYVDVLVPTNVTANFPLFEGEQIIKLSLGGNHGAVLTDLNRVFSWGTNSVGQVGNLETMTYVGLPVEITSNFSLALGEVIIDIEFGQEHSAALTSSGRVFMWGSNVYGELGDGMSSSMFTGIPQDITSYLILTAGESVDYLDLGANKTTVITTNNRVLVWGDAYSGALGNGNEFQVEYPLDITANFSLSIGESIISIDFNQAHSIAISNLGKVYTWGLNTDGQLGDLGNIASYYPKKINYPYSEDNKLLSTYIEERVNFLKLTFKLTIIPEYEILPETVRYVEVNGIKYSENKLEFSNGRINVYVTNSWYYNQTANFTVNGIKFMNGNYMTATGDTTASTLLSDDIYPPEIVYDYPENLIIEKGLGSDDLLSGFGLDDTGEIITLIYTGSVDWQTPGTYELSYFVEDTFYNSTEALRIVTVVDEVSDSEFIFGDFTIRYFENEIYTEFTDLNIPLIAYDGGNYHSLTDYSIYEYHLFNNTLIYDFVIEDNYFLFDKVVYYPDTIAPTFDFIPDQGIEAGQVTTFPWTVVILNAADNSGGILTKEIVYDGVIYDTVGRYEVIVKVVDESLNETSQSFWVDVVDNIAPTFDAIPDQTIEINEFVDIDWRNLVVNLTDNSSGELILEEYDRVDYTKNGIYIVTIIARDGSNNYKSLDFTVEVKDTLPPTFDFIEEQLFEAGSFYELDWTDLILNCTDNSQGVIYLEEVVDNVDFFTVGVYEVIVKARDESGNFSSQSFYVNIVDNLSPYFSFIDDQIIEAGELQEIDWTKLEYNIFDNTYEEFEVYILEDNVNYLEVGIYQVTLATTDSSGNLGTVTFNVNVIDTTAPYFEIFMDFQIEIKEYEDYNWTDKITFIQDCSLIERIEVEDNVIYNKIGTYEVVVMVQDQYLNSSSMTIYVTVADTVSPSLTLNPSVDTIYVGDSYLDQGILVQDNTETDVSISGSVDTLNAGTYLLTYTVTDEAENSSVIKRVVTVVERAEVRFVLGPALTTILYGSDYIDGTCMVNIGDEEFACSVKASDLDTSLPGVYHITYAYTYLDKEYTYKRYIIVYEESDFKSICLPIWKRDEEL
jgi:alpha-tubulin suppressor-like RCC1 family protein